MRVEYLLLQTYEYAMRFSTDPSTQNAAMLVDDNMTPIILDANHFPTGVEESKERWERPLKYSFVEHAERNVIFRAAKLGIKCQGLTMICPWFACADCARAIVQSGIKEVIGHDSRLRDNNPRWEESVKIGDTILQEGGVAFSRIQASFPNIKFLYNGKLETP